MESMIGWGKLFKKILLGKGCVQGQGKGCSVLVWMSLQFIPTVMTTSNDIKTVKNVFFFSFISNLSKSLHFSVSDFKAVVVMFHF